MTLDRKLQLWGQQHRQNAQQQADSIDMSELVAKSASRAPHGRSVLAIAATVLAILGIAAASGSWLHKDSTSLSAAASQGYPLASNGSLPDDGTRSARISGQFHARYRDGAVCAWLGSSADEVPTLWPSGWRVRFSPTELLAPDGTVFAKEGERLSAAGGLSSAGFSPGVCDAQSNVYSLTEITHT